MKDYIPKRPEEYRLEKSLYLRVLHTVRDYPRMKQKIDDVLFGSGCDFTEYVDEDGKTKRTILPHGTGTSNPTEQKALAVQQYAETVNAIDNALAKIPLEYRQYVFDNVVYKSECPDCACKNTWSKWRIKFLRNVAENLKFL